MSFFFLIAVTDWNISRESDSEKKNRISNLDHVFWQISKFLEDFLAYVYEL